MRQLAYRFVMVSSGGAATVGRWTRSLPSLGLMVATAAFAAIPSPAAAFGFHPDVVSAITVCAPGATEPPGGTVPRVRATTGGPPLTTLTTSGSGSNQTLGFSSPSAGSTFRCSVGRAHFKSCHSPLTFTLHPGVSVVVRVRATDPFGATGPIASLRLTGKISPSQPPTCRVNCPQPI